jgi:CDP-diacylglycerol---serine O-phosphatidyltransferase
MILRSLQITFGVATAAIAFTLGFRTLVDQLFLTFYVLCGLTRLARFNVTVAMLPKDKTGKSKYFEGFPIPFACLIGCTITGIWSYMDLIHDDIPFGTNMKGTVFEYHNAVLLYGALGCCMVSKSLRIPKP